ncbi:hypothetical protein F5148DRAFT_1169420 [Russula earlei]|uniref:Uncharacterized protein n=1 Tax=Russula earlei TaxID=71964 RepID=A0ACC0UJ18_9AGAM|nr:hypothetical protein F5148DRAFT_1169420 [Russula earlei]
MALQIRVYSVVFFSVAHMIPCSTHSDGTCHPQLSRRCRTLSSHPYGIPRWRAYCIKTSHNNCMNGDLWQEPKKDLRGMRNKICCRIELQ